MKDANEAEILTGILNYIIVIHYANLLHIILLKRTHFKSV